MFLSIDGGDGTGKSTQAELLRAWLTAGGHDVVRCRDPGSTPLGEAVRGLLLDRHDLAIDRRSEMLLYMSARAQLVEEVIRPALAAGKTVLSDRYLLANVVYQGHAGGLDVDTLWQVGRVATGGLMPDLTIVLDMPADAAAGRLDRELDRMEQQGDAFHARVRNGFLTEAARDPERIAVINAARAIEEVQAEIQAAVRRAVRLPDIEVVMTFIRAEDGGRKSPVYSGYRPQFYYDGHDWDAEHTYPGVEAVNPGDTVTAQLQFLSPQSHCGKILPGTEFLIREGKRTVATGRVTKILHLEENAERMRSIESKRGNS